MAGREGFERDPYDREYAGVVPDIVKQFVVYLYRHIRERNIPEIQSMYEVSFPKLSERYFKTGSWPTVDLINDLVDEDHVFCLLYKELFYRHLYAKVSPGLRARCGSWDNYCELFGVILHGNVNMVLPTLWLWDMVDEFLYQFQSFCQYRSKLATKTAEEIDMLKQCDKVWNALDVLNVLQALIDRSGIVAELSVEGAAATLANSDGYLPGQSNVLRMLGYFSLPGQLRVHSLIGDYYSALQSLHPLNPLERTPPFTAKLPSTHISLHYYSSFAYLMLRRYTDAGRCINSILMYISRIKAVHARNASYDQILKKNEQLYALAAVTVALCPAVQRQLDEHVLVALKEKYGDQLARMSRGEQSPFDELFSYGCPKFVSAAPPSYEHPSSVSADAAFRAQLTLFLREVRGSNPLPRLKEHLQLYSSISLPKLATLLDVDVASLRTALQCLKAKSYCLQWDGGASALSGKFVSTSDIDFHIDLDPSSGDEVVNVSESVHTRLQAEVLGRHISKLTEIIRDLEAPPAVVPVAAAAAGAAVKPGSAQAAY